MRLRGGEYGRILSVIEGCDGGDSGGGGVWKWW